MGAVGRSVLGLYIGYLLVFVLVLAILIVGIYLFRKVYKHWKQERTLLKPQLVACIIVFILFGFFFDYNFRTVARSQSMVDASLVAELSSGQVGRLEDIAGHLRSFDFIEWRYMLDATHPSYDAHCHDQGIFPYYIPYELIDGEWVHQPGSNFLAKMYKMFWRTDESTLEIEIFIYKGNPPHIESRLLANMGGNSMNPRHYNFIENDNGTAVLLMHSTRHIRSDVDYFRRWRIGSGISFDNASIILTERQALIEGQNKRPPEKNLTSEFIALLCSLLQDDELLMKLSNTTDLE
jgi:hypothetical protein